MKKILIYVFFVIAVIGVSSITYLNVKAEDTNNYPPIVQKLVNKFNLKPEEVKQVFDEQKKENHEKRQAKFEERLNQAITDGKITESQKNDILAKADEVKAKIESFKDLSASERKAKMKELREEIIAWGKEKGIESKFLPIFGRFGKGFMMGYELGQKS